MPIKIKQLKIGTVLIQLNGLIELGELNGIIYIRIKSEPGYVKW
jgi:hypothetical protein